MCGGGKVCIYTLLRGRGVTLIHFFANLCAPIRYTDSEGSVRHDGGDGHKGISGT